MAIRNVKLTIAYDGTEYHGWQIQPGLRTIQGVLAEAIGDLLGCKVRVCGASRTDAGVSALGQVGLIQIDSPIPTENLAGAITDRLPADMAVYEAVEVPHGFDVIGAVKRKWYRYTIVTGEVRPVLQIRHCWHVSGKLDTAAMSDAAKMLVGEKDFKSFASAADKRESSVRTIFLCDVTEENAWVYLDVQGNSFLYNMVRNIVGTLVEVGTGRWKPEKISEILEARDRTAAGPIAPAAGLCLMRIEY
jgi:tRNA pseudouridine38-40 synthase